MKKITFFLFSFIAIHCYGQVRIFSLGYGKTFVTSDSTTLNITFDLNRVPGQLEKTGGFYFLNERFSGSKWGYYLKPTIDVNIGSTVSSSPNNISVGMPIGLAYDIPKTKVGFFSLYIEGSPELIADKSFRNSLYYFSENAYIKYELLTKAILLNILAGVSNANGVRDQFEQNTNAYGRFTMPFYLKLSCWNDTAYKGKANAKPFKRISWTNSFKFNTVYDDDRTINSDRTYTYFNSKFDFYFTPNFGLNITYFNGNEEPLFKRNNAITFGLTLAR